MAIKTLNGCGVLKVDNDTIVLDDTTNVISVPDGVVSLPIATTTVLGGVIPDGTKITVSETGVVADLNTLIGKLKTAGLMTNA